MFKYKKSFRTFRRQAALSAVNSLDGGGYDDWFLPSRDELDAMYDNLKVYSVGGFADDDYWSSSEFGSYFALYQNFSNGDQDDNIKWLENLVRAVRAF